jgi:hypothetical protein
MREHHRIGVGGDPRFPADRRGQACRIDAQQHKIGSPGIEPVGRQMHLLRRRQVDEPVRAQRIGPMLTDILRPPPLIGTANVDQSARQTRHIVSLHRSQLNVSVRHDTPVNPRGTRLEPKTSETVDVPEAFTEVAMNATLTSPELTKADRCDRCGAAARVRAKLPSGAELLFCQHHANEHEAKLVELAAVIEVSALEL